MPPTPIHIVGAGLSGLCLAQALVRAGFDVHVYERDPSPHARRQGYRLTIDYHGVAALKSCLPPSLFDSVRATASTGARIGYMRFTNERLGEIFTLTFKRDERPEEEQLLGQLDRTTLRTIMLSGLEDRVEFGMAVRGVEMDPSGATLYFSDGASARAALVVGADGTDSQVRATLLPDCPVVDSGTWGIYGKSPLMKNGEPLIPAALKDSGILALAGAGRFFFCTAMDFDNPPQEIFERLVPDQEPPITEDYLMWAVGLPNQLLPDDAWQLRPGALHRLALDGCRDFHPLLRNFIEQADVDYTILTALSVATRPKQWTASRVTLLGDAVHTMPPTGGHGGNTALRDAALLAAKLQAAVDADTPVEEAVTAYQREMLAYAFEEVDSSVAMLRRAALTNPLARVAVLRMLPALRSRMSGPLVPE